MKLAHLILLLAVLPINQPAFAAKKCSDFKTQGEAQAQLSFSNKMQFFVSFRALIRGKDS